jgi:hypothetical protein
LSAKPINFTASRGIIRLFNRIKKREKQFADPQKAILLRILGISEVTLPETPEACIERLFGKQHPPRHPGQLSLPRADTAEVCEPAGCRCRIAIGADARSASRRRRLGSA